MTAPIPAGFPYPKQDPLRQSVTSLALVAMQAAGADGCHVAERERDGSLVNRYSNGVPLPAWVDPAATGIVHRDGVVVVAYLLRTEGILAGRLAFVFASNAISADKFAILNRLAPMIEAVQALPYITARLASRLARLDAELAGSKIVERARGILAGGAPEQESVETIIRHVETVLEGRHFGSVLRQLLPDMEQRIAQRQLVGQAKAILETRHGMSEEEAYLHLRLKSRTSRRPLSEVARELLSAEAGACEEPTDVRT